MSWSLHSPRFEFLTVLPDDISAWTGHVHFAYDLVCDMHPRLVVELGTHHGHSFFAMCQAVKDQSWDTELVAVDSWHGDGHTAGYGEEVFERFLEVLNQFYSSVAARPMRMQFDEARGEFSEGAVDILHIDGYHALEAVTHDFDMWIGAVRPAGVVLFHDTAETAPGFGVHELWAHLVETRPTLTFVHEHGLGVMLNAPAATDSLRPIELPLRSYYENKASARLAEFECGRQAHELEQMAALSVLDAIASGPRG